MRLGSAGRITVTVPSVPTIRIDTYGLRNQQIVLRRVRADSDPFLEIQVGAPACLIPKEQVPALVRAIVELMG